MPPAIHPDSFHLLTTSLFLGALLLATGIVIGGGLVALSRRWLPTRTAEAPQELSALAVKLADWTSDVSQNVTQYRAMVESLALQVIEASENGRHSPETAATLLTRMLEANQLLAERLDSAETTLAGQTQEMAGYISAARTDPLTGLANRRLFDEALTTALSAWNMHSSAVVVLLLDIDHFKHINDTYGHPTGDAVLREMASLLVKHLPCASLVARYGGEEFACIVPNLDLLAAAAAANELRRAIEQHTFSYQRQSLTVTASCGLAQATFHEPPHSLLQRSDAALYAAKSAGRNTVYMHDGYHTIPLPGVEKSLAPAAPDVSPGVTEFRDVCQDLRSRLAQVIEGNAV